MKHVLILFTAILLSGLVKAQQKELPQPFKDGNDAMTQFFKDSLQVSPGIIKAKATGLAVFKFTADDKGSISKIVVYFADDYLLVEPVINALKKSAGKWVIPERYKSYDFIIPVSINFTPNEKTKLAAQKAIYSYYIHRKPILAVNQVPLNQATLLPTIVVNY